MKVIKNVYRKYRGLMLKYTLYMYKGKYIISVTKCRKSEEATTMLKDNCTQSEAIGIFEYVCSSGVTPCALSDIIDDMIQLTE